MSAPQETRVRNKGNGNRGLDILQRRLPNGLQSLAIVFVATIMVTSMFLLLVAPPALVGGSSHLPAISGNGVQSLARPDNGSGNGSGGGSGGNGSGGSGGSGNAPITPILSGKETFFTNVNIPNATSAHAGCIKITYYGGFFKYCYNATVDPSFNEASTGVTGAAFTVFTNDSPCAAMSGNATTEVGFSMSRNFGDSWSTPVILGNPVCSGGQNQNYSNAFEPSLTSLSNGTFVLAYAEFNTSATAYAYDTVYPYQFDCEYTTHTRVVVTESYDNGSTWTTPTVLNETDVNSSAAAYNCVAPGISDMRPSTAAFGQTAYVSWMNFSNPVQSYYGYSHPYSGAIQIAVSTNGGASWTNASMPDSEISTSVYPYSNITAYPYLLVNPSGELFVSYGTDFGELFVCLPTYCTYEYSASLVLASTTDNGTLWNYSTINASINVGYTYSYTYSPFLVNPMSQLAWNPVTNQLYAIWSGGEYGDFCYNYVTSYYCYNGEFTTATFFAYSNDSGNTWSNTIAVDQGRIVNSSGGWINSEARPSIGVTSDGEVHIQYTETNDSLCKGIGTPAYYYYCGFVQQVYQNSTNDGLNWSIPVYVSSNQSLGYASCGTCAMFQGTTSSIVTNGTEVLLGWARYYCPTSWTVYCYWGGSPGAVLITASRLFEGVGITMTFNETGLPSSGYWVLNVGGYLRQGPAGANLSISGVPPSDPLTYWSPWYNQSYGDSFYGTFAPGSPSGFTANATVKESYSEQFLLNVRALPNLGTQFQFGYTNYQISPLLGAYWYAKGTAVTLTVTPNAPLFCYPCSNLTWLDWIGTGNGSVTSNSTSVTPTINGVINETATFGYLGWCYGTFSSCHGANYTQSFIQSGLPGGTEWGVTIVDANGTTVTNESVDATLVFNVPSTPVNYVAWSVPAGGGKFWVPTGSSKASPFTEPSPPITIYYTLQTLSSTATTSWVEETGLPSGSQWGFEAGGTHYGLGTSNSSLSLPLGTTSVNATSVYEENGTGYYPASISVESLVVNQSSTKSITPGASVTLNGSALITVNYAPQYLVTVTAGAGGTVTPASTWVHNGQALPISATPSAGYHFVGWTGSGSGSVTSGTASTSVSPHSPVTEFATFRINAPLTWNLTLSAVGLPAGASFSVVLGGVTYTSTGTLKVGNLSTGDYAIAAPTVYANASNTTRYLPTNIATSGTVTAGMLNVSANGTVTVTYVTQYVLSVASTSGGVTSTGSGEFWENASTAITLTATPNSGYLFVGWNGTVTGSSPSLPLTITGVMTESAAFKLRPISIPATYDLAVTETGLPAGTTWSVSLGSQGASGNTATLTVAGLNGTYALTAATVYSSTAGTRFDSNANATQESVTANGTFSVAYSTEYLVTTGASSGGTISPATEWVASGTMVTVTAAPSSGQELLYWNGTDSTLNGGTATSDAITVTGPVNVFATFGPIPSTTGGQTTSSSSSSTNGLLTTLVAVVALLMVGLVVGLLVGRRRPPASSAPAAEEMPSESVAEMPSESAAPESDAPPVAEYDEGPPSQ